MKQWIRSHIRLWLVFKSIGIFCLSAFLIYGAWTFTLHPNVMSDGSQSLGAMIHRGAFSDTAKAAKGDKSNFEKMSDIAKDMSDDGNYKDALGNHPDIAGNAWSQLGNGSKFLLDFTGPEKTASYMDLVQIKPEGYSPKGAAATYGMMLNEMGLDHSYQTMSSQQMIPYLGRLFGGGLIWLGYSVEAMVNWAFALAVKVLSWLNIFQWATNPKAAAGTPFAGVANVFNQVYKLTSGLGTIVVVALFALTLMLAIMGWKLSKSSTRTGMGSGVFGSYVGMVVRMLIILGAPLFAGMLYTSMLNTTKGAYSGLTGSDYAVYTNLVDFKGWAQHSRLAVPSSLDNSDNVGLPVYNPKKWGSSVPIVTHSDVTQYNALGAGDDRAFNIAAIMGFHSGTNPLGGNKTKSLNDTKSTLSTNASTLLLEWTLQTPYFASDWESYAKTHFSGTDADKYKKAVTGDGGLDVGGEKTRLKNPYEPYYGYGANKNDAKIGEGSDAGLSSLGMYNYLLTVFNDTSMTWIDAGALGNSVSQPEHAAVGLSGRGIVAFGNYMLMFALIWSMALLGAAFAWFVIDALIVSIPRLIGSLGAATFGSPIYFVKLLSVVFTVIIDVLGGAILFMISRQILLALTTIGDSVVSGQKLFQYTSMIMPHNLALAGGISSTAYGAINIFEAILLFLVGARLIKARGPILEMFGQMIEGGLNNFLNLFESTREGSHNFDRGGAGLPTTDANGNNNAGLSYGGEPAGGGAYGGAYGGGFDEGSARRHARIGNPKTALGRSFNRGQAFKDYLNAQKGEKGRSLTNPEKKAAFAKFYGGQALGKGLRMAGAAMGSKGLQNLADDLQSRQDVNISNGLRKDAANTQASQKDPNLDQDADDYDYYQNRQEKEDNQNDNDRGPESETSRILGGGYRQDNQDNQDDQDDRYHQNGEDPRRDLQSYDPENGSTHDENSGSAYQAYQAEREAYLGHPLSGKEKGKALNDFFDGKSAGGSRENRQSFADYKEKREKSLGHPLSDAEDLNARNDFMNGKPAVATGPSRRSNDHRDSRANNDIKKPKPQTNGGAQRGRRSSVASQNTKGIQFNQTGHRSSSPLPSRVVGTKSGPVASKLNGSIQNGKPMPSRINAHHQVSRHKKDVLHPNGSSYTYKQPSAVQQVQSNGPKGETDGQNVGSTRKVPAARADQAKAVAIMNAERRQQGLPVTSSSIPMEQLGRRLLNAKPQAHQSKGSQTHYPVRVVSSGRRPMKKFGPGARRTTVTPPFQKKTAKAAYPKTFFSPVDASRYMRRVRNDHRAATAAIKQTAHLPQSDARRQSAQARYEETNRALKEAQNAVMRSYNQAQVPTALKQKSSVSLTNKAAREALMRLKQANGRVYDLDRQLSSPRRPIRTNSPEQIKMDQAIAEVTKARFAAKSAGISDEVLRSPAKVTSALNDIHSNWKSIMNGHYKRQ